MRKMHKLATAAIGALAVVALLAGCGKSGKSTATKDDGKITLTYLTYDAKRDAKGNLQIQDVANAYMKKHPNIKIKIDVQAENNSVDFLKKLDMLQLSGKTGDVVLLPSYREYAARAKKGFFYDLGKYYQADGGYDKLYGYPSAVDKKYYGIPFNPDIYVTYINKKMLDAAGEKIPSAGWTWDDYAALAKKMTKGSGANKVYGSYMHTWPEFRHEGLYNSIMDNPYIKPNGKSNLNDPQFAEWLTFMKKMEDDGIQVPYADAKSTNIDYNQEFLQGKTGMMVTGTWLLTNILDTEKYPHDFDTVVAPFPVWKDGKAGTTQGGVSYQTVGKNSKHPKEAYEFARYVSGKGAVEGQYKPATKNGDIKSVITEMVGKKTNLFDVKSLLDVWENPNITLNTITREPDKYVEIDGIFDTETQKFMLGDQSVKQTMDNIKKQAEPIIAK